MAGASQRPPAAFFLEETGEAPGPENAPFGPLLAMREFIACRELICILEGPAGTGKSRGAMEKIHARAQKYPGYRALVCRNTRKACTDSVMVTFEERVLPDGHPFRNEKARENRHSYIYPNRAEIVIGGLDEPTKLLSTEYDDVYVNESNECTEDQVSPLLRCLRNGKTPYHQLILDLNPTIEDFWLYEWEASGTARLFFIGHECNPTLDPEYIRNLDRTLKGSLHRSLVKGLRIAAVEGAYWGEDMLKVRDEGRVKEPLTIDKRLPVHTAWDLGLAGGTGLSSGYMAIWLFQVAPFGVWGEWRWLKYIEGAGNGIEWYCGKLKEWRDETGVVFGTHHLPHDGETADMYTGKSRKDAMEETGFPSIVVPRFDTDDAIGHMSNILGYSWFDHKHTRSGRQRLSFFRREKDTKTGLFTGRYRHDESSHGAFAALTAAMGYAPPIQRKEEKPARHGEDYGGAGGRAY